MIRISPISTTSAAPSWKAVGSKAPPPVTNAQADLPFSQICCVQLIAPLTAPAAAYLYVQPTEDPLVPVSEADPGPNVNPYFSLTFKTASPAPYLRALAHVGSHDSVYVGYLRLHIRVHFLHFRFSQIIFFLMTFGRLAVASCPFYTKVALTAHWSVAMTFLLRFQHGQL